METKNSKIELNTDNLEELIHELTERKYSALDFVSENQIFLLGYLYNPDIFIYRFGLQQSDVSRLSITEIAWIKMLIVLTESRINLTNPVFQLKVYFGEYQSHEQELDELEEIYWFPPVKIVDDIVHNEFARLLANSIYSHNPVALRIYEDKVEFYADSDLAGIGVLEKYQEDYEDSFRSFISVSIEKILLDMVPNIDFNIKINPGIGNSLEKKLLKYISKKQIRRADMYDESGVQHLDFNQSENNIEKARLIYQSVLSSKYRKIEYETLNGETSSAQPF